MTLTLRAAIRDFDKLQPVNLKVAACGGTLDKPLSCVHGETLSPQENLTESPSITQWRRLELNSHCSKVLGCVTLNKLLNLSVLHSISSPQC